MRRTLLAITIYAVVFPLASHGVGAQIDADDFYRQWVDYHDGEISLDFDRTPVVFALHAIQAKTGFEIVIPSSTDARLLNFRLRRQPLEPAMRTLISTIGYENFALVYDDAGRPSRAVVLNARTASPQTQNESVKTDSPKEALTTEERDTMQKELSRWRELKPEERSKIEARLKSLPAGEDREKLMSEYGRQVLESAR